MVVSASRRWSDGTAASCSYTASMSDGASAAVAAASDDVGSEGATASPDDCASPPPQAASISSARTVASARVHLLPPMPCLLDLSQDVDLARWRQLEGEAIPSRGGRSHHAHFGS